MTEFPLILKGSRVELRVVEPTFENAKMVFDTVAANREHLLEWMLWAGTEITGKPEDSFDFLLRMQENRKNKYEYAFGIFLGGGYIGNITVFDISEQRKTGKIGCWLIKDATGKGYMTEAMKLMEDAFFQSMGNCLQIRCDPNNIPSQGIPKRLNYHLDGELRQDNVLRGGGFRNTLVYSKLKSEWEKENE